jgi:hypothetical protein
MTPDPERRANGPETHVAAGGRPPDDLLAPGEAAASPTRPGMVTAWPDLFFRELLVTLLCVVVLAAISMLLNAPLEDAADPARTPSPARAPWYFAGLQELLTYFDPWVAGVAIPTLIIFGLCAIPYIDTSRTGQGVYTIRERPLASMIFITGIVGWFALIAIGFWFRGPGWAWVWPWSGAAHAGTVGAARSLPNLVGVPLVLAFFIGGGRWIVRRTAGWPGFTSARRWVFALLLLAMAGTAIKIVLKLAFGLQYLVRFDRLGLNL